MNRIKILVVALLAIGLAGCAAAAAGAAAGAAGGIYLTSRGASALVEGTVPQVTQRTYRVFRDLGIRAEEQEFDADDREVEIKGETDDLDVTAKIEYETARTTEVHIEAQESAVEWDQDYAKMVLERIVAQ